MPTAGTPSGSTTATTSPRSRRRSRPRDADDRPSLIAVRTHIGFGSPNKQDSQKAHGAPLGPGRGPPHQGGLRLGSGQDVLRARRGAGDVPRGGPGGERLVDDWDERLAAYAAAHPGARGGVPAADRRRARPTAGTPTSRPTRSGPRSPRGTRRRTRSRRSPGRCPELFGGAADLSESNLTDVKGEPNFSADEPGRNLRFGVREHAHGRHRQRHRLPRRVHPVRRDVPDVQRLHARRGAAVGARRAARDPRLDARLGRASARTARPTSRSSTTRRCARSRTCGSCGRATPTRRPRPGRWPWSGATGRWRWRSPARSSAAARGHGREGARGRAARRLRAARRGAATATRS